MVTATKRQQMSMGEETLDDPTGELERLLDERAVANEQRKPGMRTFKAKHTLAKEAVEKIINERELGPGEYRIGYHIVTVRKNEPREISFDRASSTVISFKFAK